MEGGAADDARDSGRALYLQDDRANCSLVCATLRSVRACCAFRWSFVMGVLLHPCRPRCDDPTSVLAPGVKGRRRSMTADERAF